MPRQPSPLERIAKLFADPKSRAANAPRLTNPWVIFAIGNPGARYTDTRHNVAWWAADALREQYNARIQDEGSSQTAQVKIENQSAIIAYPKTYVNRSGIAVRSLLDNYNTDISHLIVITDDINLSPGRIRIRRSGSDGGHNGLKSIISALSDNGFPRIRIGVGKPSSGDTQINHVLGKPEAYDMIAIQSAIERVVGAIHTIVVSGVEVAMNKYNSTGR